MRRASVIIAVLAVTSVIGCRRQSSDSTVRRATDASPKLVSFPTDDGGVVFADEYGAGDRAVVLAHGGRFTKESWADQAPVIAADGFRVLAIDFRGRGKSGGGSQTPDGEYLDVLAAVRYLRKSGAKSVAVVGASFGGWAAAGAFAAARPGEIDKLVLLAASSIDAPEKLTCPKLFIAARDDVIGDGDPRFPLIQALYDRAPEPKEIIALDGSAHAQFIFETDQADRLLSEIRHFLAEP